MKQAKTITWRVRVDSTTDAQLKYLETKPWFVNLSHYMREVINKAAMKEHEHELQTARAIERASEPEPKPVVRDPRLSPAERYHGHTTRLEAAVAGERGLFRPHLNAGPRENNPHPLASVPVRRIPTAIEDDSETT